MPRSRREAYERGAIFDRRLFSMAPGVGRLVAAKVLCQWIGLLANVVFVFTLAHMLEYLLLGTEITVLNGRLNGFAAHVGTSTFAAGPPGGAIAAYAIVIVFAMMVRFLMLRSAAHFGTEAAEQVKLALREKLFNKMLALGPSYSQRVGTADVVQSPARASSRFKVSSNCSCPSCSMPCWRRLRCSLLWHRSMCRPLRRCSSAHRSSC